MNFCCNQSDIHPSTKIPKAPSKKQILGQYRENNSCTKANGKSPFVLFLPTRVENMLILNSLTNY